MKYLPIVLVIAAALAVCHFDAPEQHIANSVQSAENACLTPLEAYNHVSLIAAQRRK